MLVVPESSVPNLDGQSWSQLTSDLVENGYVGVENPLLREDCERLSRAFAELVLDVGSEELAAATWSHVSVRRGATSGYSEKPAGQRGSAKRAFTFRIPETLNWGRQRQAAPILKEFVEQGTEIMNAVAAAMRECVEVVDTDFPGLLAAHYSYRPHSIDPDQRPRQDFDMRIVQYDSNTRSDKVVSSPHRDLSSLTLHVYDSNPGSFYAVREYEDGRSPRLCFPARDLGNKAVLFTGCRLRVDQRNPLWPHYTGRHPVVVCPDFPGTPIWHGAFANETGDEARRTVIVAQLHPRPNMPLNVASESYHHKEPPQRVTAALSQGLDKS
jgi:hypothetical protein